MKIWFFARSEGHECLYIKINSYAAKELALTIAELNKLSIQTISASLFNNFVTNSSEEIYFARVCIKGNKYCFIEDDAVTVKKSAFFTRDLLKNLPVVKDNAGKNEIIRSCYLNWKNLIQ
jgi:hypothetical protein